jgi:hypothetical protein
MRGMLAGPVRAALFAGVILTGVSSGHAADTVSGLQAADPQPAPDALEPGLAVTYYFNKFDDTREIPDWAKYKDGVEGEPITMLDYFVGDREVLTSGRTDHVGADIRGFIHLPVAGTYTFAMRSNDGVDLKIGDKRIVHDSGVHSDRFPDLIPVEVAAPGWYPFHLLYFEKQVTSTVELYCLKPGDTGQLDFVPEEAFAHDPAARAQR